MCHLPTKSADHSWVVMEHLYKTAVCKYYLRGCCRQGTECTYAHSFSEIRGKPAAVSAKPAKPVHNGESPTRGVGAHDQVSKEMMDTLKAVNRCINALDNGGSKGSKQSMMQAQRHVQDLVALVNVKAEAQMIKGQLSKPFHVPFDNYADSTSTTSDPTPSLCTLGAGSSQGNDMTPKVGRTFKTKMCHFWKRGACKSGESCRFAHHPLELAGAAVQSGELPVMDAHDDSGVAAPSILTEKNVAIPNANMPEVDFTGLARPVRQDTGESQSDDGKTSETPPPPHSSQSDSSDSGEAPESSGNSQGDNAESSGSDNIESSGSGGSNGSQGDNTESSGSQGENTNSTVSTKASTGVSTSSPAGSVDPDSGEDGQRQKGLPHPIVANPTTMLLMNVPEFLDQGDMVRLFDHLSPGVSTSIDFFYLPWDPNHCRNLGYAIINFVDTDHASSFQCEWNNKELTEGAMSDAKWKWKMDQGLKIVPAIIQGKAKNVCHFSTFSLTLTGNLEFGPLARSRPEDPLLPVTSASCA